MDFYDVIARRRMVRHFTPEPIDPEVVERIVRAAERAPSAGFSQGVASVVVTDPDMRQRIGRIAHEENYTSDGFHPFISEAPVQVIVCTSEKIYKDRYREPDKMPDPTVEQKEWPVPYWHTDAGMALVLILMAAINEGLAGAFVGVWDQQGLREALGIPDHFTPIGIAMIGHPAPDVPSPSLKRGRKPASQTLHWENW